MKYRWTMAIAFLLLTDSVYATGWTEPQQVKRGRDSVAAYRAVLQGDLLVIEVKHEPGWHTYTMDNVLRARKQSGEEKPQTELPTRIAISGGLKVSGDWRQSDPKDLSDPSIQWYTWGFENTTYFAAQVERTGDADATVTINAQACDASSCAMVDDLEITLNLERNVADTAVEIGNLVVVESEASEVSAK